MSLREQLQGTGVALVTPFNTKYNIDFDALERVIDSVITNGVEYVVTLGTTGETPTLEKQEKLDILQYTYEKVNGRVPIVVGIGGNNTNSLVKDLQTFPLEKAAAVLSVSPYYSKPSQEGIFEHYKTLAQASPKPLLLYNVTGRTGRNITTATTIKLANEVANIAGIKEAGGDMQQCMEILRDRPKDFLIVSGDDGLGMSQIACGMDGVISVAANAFPKAFAQLVRLALNNDFEAARAIQYKLLKAYDYMFEENNPAGIKAFLYEKGLIQNILRLPVTPVSKELQQSIRQFVKEYQ